MSIRYRPGIVQRLFAPTQSRRHLDSSYLHICKNAFNDQQNNALQDYLAASVMLRHNDAEMFQFKVLYVYELLSTIK